MESELGAPGHPRPEQNGVVSARTIDRWNGGRNRTLLGLAGEPAEFPRFAVALLRDGGYGDLLAVHGLSASQYLHVEVRSAGN